MIAQYQKLKVWQSAYNFVLKVYTIVETFPSYEDNNITSQLRRAATCLPLNIAEGSGARSPKIFLNYLIFAYRSSREIETLLLLARDLKYLDEARYNEVNNDLQDFTKMLVGYMDYLERDYIGSSRKKDLTHFYRQKKEGFVSKNFEHLA
ncbi:MAG: four helix bundle protein [Nanoarchaeota archaeon]